MEYKILDEVIECLIDYRGRTPKKSDNGIKMLSAKTVKMGYIDYDNAYYISQEEFNKFAVRGEIKKGDILVTTEAPLGCIAKLSRNDVGIAQRLIALRGKKDILDNDYLMYYLMSKEGQYELLSRETGTTVTGIKQSEIRKIKVPIPDINIQKKIAKCLSNIDKKIELNNKINENLQEIIKEEYKEKILNNLNISLKKMNELIETTIGGDWGKEEFTGNYNSEVLCIRGADIPEINNGSKGKAPIRFILEKNLINKQLYGNEIIIEISGGSPTQSTGRCVYITAELKKTFDKPLICTNFCRAIKLKETKYLPIFYMNLKELYAKNIMFLYENGTTGIKNLDLTSLMENEEIKICSDEDINKFNELFYIINKKIIKNSDQNRTLEQLRDLLLPKLMNGEIDLNKIVI